MSKIIQTGSTTEGNYSLVGTLTTSDALANNAYIINNDKFWNVGDLINSGKAVSVSVFPHCSIARKLLPLHPCIKSINYGCKERL